MASSPRIGSIVRTVVYLALLVAVLFWLLQFEVKSAQVDSPAPAEAAESGLLSVEATSSEAQSFERTLILQGQVTPNAQVDLRAVGLGHLLALLGNLILHLRRHLLGDLLVDLGE